MDWAGRVKVGYWYRLGTYRGFTGQTGGGRLAGRCQGRSNSLTRWHAHSMVVPVLCSTDDAARTNNPIIRLISDDVCFPCAERHRLTSGILDVHVSGDVVSEAQPRVRRVVDRRRQVDVAGMATPCVLAWVVGRVGFDRELDGTLRFEQQLVLFPVVVPDRDL